MRRASALIAFASSFVVAFALAAPARAAIDDNFFPPAAAAKPFIDFDGKGFIVRGRRTFLVSGSVHYPRVPRALWRDRLLRMKRAGFNTVQTYVFWNAHEAREGHFDFSGNLDLDAYLKLIKSLGMYATVRVGPYICAEWDSGGYPVWLRFKPGLRVRVNEPQFMKAVDRYYEHVIPIVAANQIHRGGAVILVQLENEHPQAWGTSMPNSYFKHLRDKALSLGLEVPYVFSGVHHGPDPAGFRPWQSAGRTSPWYCTEFWPGWYDLYGPMEAHRERATARGAWKIVAYGGNGYNFYMLHGGTNFGYTNNDEDCSSYDYSGAIGQAGDLRPIYYDFKRTALFARTFENILAGGECRPEGPGITHRWAGDESILFYDVHFAEGFDDPKWRAFSGDIWPDVTGYRIGPGEIMSAARTPILGIAHQGATTTVVAYGPPGGSALLEFSPADERRGANVEYLGRLGQGIPIPSDRPHVEELRVPNGRLRVVVMSGEMADHTWFVDVDGVQYVVYGPDYVGDVTMRGGRLRMETEQPASESGAPSEGLVFGPAAAPVPIRPVEAPKPFHPSVEMGAWRAQRADGMAQPGASEAGWLRTPDPQALGADGDTTAYAWYRAHVAAPAAGRATLHFEDVGDWIDLFVNGRPVGASPIKRRFLTAVARDFDVDLKAGDNTIAVFAAHFGRDKLAGYMGVVSPIDRKGVNGSVTLTQGAKAVPVTGWAMRGGIGQPKPGDWRPAAAAPGVPAFYSASFTLHGAERGDRSVLRLAPAGLSRGFAWLNGHNLGRYPEKMVPINGLFLPECWLRAGKNELIVFDEEGKSPSGASVVVEAQASRIGSVWVSQVAGK
jgi:beta-galactosidase